MSASATDVSTGETKTGDVALQPVTELGDWNQYPAPVVPTAGSPRPVRPCRQSSPQRSQHLTFDSYNCAAHCAAALRPEGCVRHVVFMTESQNQLPCGYLFWVKIFRSWQDSNLQSPDPKSGALSIRPHDPLYCFLRNTRSLLPLLQSRSQSTERIPGDSQTKLTKLLVLLFLGFS